MPGSGTFILGQWNAICDRCGIRWKSGDIRREWTGLRVCRRCFEHRHPQDFVKGKVDRQAPEWARPEPPEIDVSVGSGNEVSESDL